MENIPTPYLISAVYFSERSDTCIAQYAASAIHTEPTHGAAVVAVLGPE